MDPAALRTALTALSLPLPTTAFLTNLTTSTAHPSRDALVAAARARILACDLAHSAALLDPSALPPLPPSVADPAVEHARLPRPVHAQVLDVEDLSRSRWDQAAALEAMERGEGTRGREVVRVAAEDDDDNAEVSESQAAGTQRQRPAEGRGATHRLVLQDSRGTKVFAVELRRVGAVAVGRTGIGEKVLLRAGTTVARGVVLLTPEDCVMLGGRVEAWHKAWMDGRLARLKEAAGGGRP